jgi:hypothetical protein
MTDIYDSVNDPHNFNPTLKMCCLTMLANHAVDFGASEELHVTGGMPKKIPGSRQTHCSNNTQLGAQSFNMRRPYRAFTQVGLG